MAYQMLLVAEYRIGFVVHFFQLRRNFLLNQTNSAKMFSFIFLFISVRFYRDLHLLK